MFGMRGYALKESSFKEEYIVLLLSPNVAIKMWVGALNKEYITAIGV
jgi:hypothetical protein